MRYHSSLAGIRSKTVYYVDVSGPIMSIPPVPSLAQIDITGA